MFSRTQISLEETIQREGDQIQKDTEVPFRCSGLKETVPQMLTFEYLVPSWWHYLGRLRRCGLIGESMSLEAGSESFRTGAISN